MRLYQSGNSKKTEEKINLESAEEIGKFGYFYEILNEKSQ